MHSQLNHTTVSRGSRSESCLAFSRSFTRRRGDRPADQHCRRPACDGRPAVRQRGTLLLDMTRLSRCSGARCRARACRRGSGDRWPQLVNHLLWAGGDQPGTMGHRSEADGSRPDDASAARWPPIFTAAVFGCARSLPTSSRSISWIRAGAARDAAAASRHRELFSLAIGGYGLFGVSPA